MSTLKNHSTLNRPKSNIVKKAELKMSTKRSADYATPRNNKRSCLADRDMLATIHERNNSFRDYTSQEIATRFPSANVKIATYYLDNILPEIDNLQTSRDLIKETHDVCVKDLEEEIRELKRDNRIMKDNYTTELELNRCSIKGLKMSLKNKSRRIDSLFRDVKQLRNAKAKLEVENAKLKEEIKESSELRNINDNLVLDNARLVASNITLEQEVDCNKLQLVLAQEEAQKAADRASSIHKIKTDLITDLELHNSNLKHASKGLTQMVEQDLVEIKKMSGVMEDRETIKKFNQGLDAMLEVALRIKSNLRSEDDFMRCTVCLDVLVNRPISINKCGHVYHSDCIRMCNNCPVCRVDKGFMQHITKAYFPFTSAMSEIVTPYEHVETPDYEIDLTDNENDDVIISIDEDISDYRPSVYIEVPLVQSDDYSDSDVTIDYSDSDVTIDGTDSDVTIDDSSDYYDSDAY